MPKQSKTLVLVPSKPNTFRNFYTPTDPQYTLLEAVSKGLLGMTACISTRTYMDAKHSNL